MLTPQQTLYIQNYAGQLQAMGADWITIMNAVNTLSASMSCDEACQRNKKLEELKKKWVDSQNQYERLPEIIEVNEKNYFDAAKGPNYYNNNILKPKYDKEAKELDQKERDNMRDTIKIFKNKLVTYTFDQLALTRLKELEKDLKTKNKSLIEDIDKHYKTTLTNERRVFYELGEVDQLNKYAYIMKIVYFILLVLYLIFGPFLKQGHYKSIKSWIKVIILIAIPFIILPIIIFWTTRQPKTKNKLNISENIKKAATYTKDVLYTYPSAVISNIV